ncbi:low molecular weight phosphatase family protein [Amycolatopsis cihanbeyliensis]|uniref:Protein-tyrosine-phosphatase n=1 Tax=Amycolatopsis cihanbeyliensis TaxID=1128664 RepID=A0A542DF31_AMYCI|nr:arsenate reductase ArsC [Amycolatopsis cihanbeyliensis]TQJ01689.1 protein-tyrosine-phosphatase [Amycolatopsis cihanbeyliensis]
MTRAGNPPQRHVADQLDRIADELADTFNGVFGHGTVTRFVYETYALLEAHATVRTHLVTLTARLARERLVDHGHAQGLVRVTVPHVLFVCVHNVGRSQLAAALLEHHAFGRVTIRSAGSRPRGEIPATITRALRELGIRLTEAYPKPLTDEMVRAADVVITMGCGDTCPVYPGKRYLDWDIADPAEAPIEKVRYIRDDLDRRVRGLLPELHREF